MRTFLDACFPTGMEGGHDGYLGYCDGKCAFQPNPLGLPVRYIISSLGSSGCGTIGDVEPGNPYWPDWINWVRVRRAEGVDPTLYCCDDGYGGSFWDGWRHADGVRYFQVAGVAEPHWWPFNYSTSTIPVYAVAVQVGGTNGFDVSLVGDYWPGVDTFEPPVIATTKETKMFLFRNDDDGAIYLVGEKSVIHLGDPKVVALYQQVLGMSHGHSGDMEELQAVSRQMWPAT